MCQEDALDIKNRLSTSLAVMKTGIGIRILKVACCLATVFALSSCGSTTKVLDEGQWRLYDNRISITNGNEYPDYSPKDLKNYIKQSPNNYYFFHWNPRLSIYNWGAGKDGKLARIFREKIGVAPVVLNTDLIASSKDGIVSHLEYLGYFNSSVRDTVEYDAERKLATVRYDVTLGKRYPIAGIEYVVPDSTMKALLDLDSLNHTIRPGMPLSESLLETESDRVAQMFRDNGYYNFTKNYFFYFADSVAVRDSANLTVRLENYTRNENSSNARTHTQYTIRQVSITPVGGFYVRRNFLNSINRIKPGDLYSESSIANTYRRFTSVPLFSNVNVQLSEVDSALLDCSIRLTSAKRQAVKFSLEGSVNSSSLFGVSPKISYSHKNLFGGGEMLTLDLMGNFQFKFNDDVKSNEFGVSAGISFPKFLLLPDRLFSGELPNTDFKLSYNYQDRPEYARSIASTSFGYKLNLTDNLYFQYYPLQLSMVYLYHIDQSFYDRLRDPFLQYSYKAHFDLGSGLLLYYKYGGFYTRWQTDVAGNLISLFNDSMKKDDQGASLLFGIPYSQYVRSEIQAVFTRPFERDERLAIAGRLMAGCGYAYGNSSALPFEKLFSAGGSSSLRGWQIRSVGPGMAPMDSTFSIANQTGDLKLEANVEFRFPIYNFLRGALFYDAGNVWNLPRNWEDLTGRSDFPDGNIPEDARGEFRFSTLGRSIAQDWGIGLRLDFNSILVRVDFGMQTYNPAEGRWIRPSEWFEGYSAFHFGVGLPF